MEQPPAKIYINEELMDEIRKLLDQNEKLIAKHLTELWKPAIPTPKRFTWSLPARCKAKFVNPIAQDLFSR